MHRFPPNVHIYQNRILEESILYNLLDSNVFRVKSGSYNPRHRLKSYILTVYLYRKIISILIR
jgi:hypothetical protein